MSVTLVKQNLKESTVLEGIKSWSNQLRACRGANGIFWKRTEGTKANKVEVSDDKLCVAAFVQLSDLSPLIDIDLFLSDHASCLLFFPLMVLFQLFTVLLLNHCRTLCGLR